MSSGRWRLNPVRDWRQCHLCCCSCIASQLRPHPAPPLPPDGLWKSSTLHDAGVSNHIDISRSTVFAQTRKPATVGCSSKIPIDSMPTCQQSTFQSVFDRAHHHTPIPTSYADRRILLGRMVPGWTPLSATWHTKLSAVFIFC